MQTISARTGLRAIIPPALEFLTPLALACCFGALDINWFACLL